MAHMDREAAGVDRDLLRQHAVERIDVAAHGQDRRDRAERVEDCPAANIPRMQNLRNARQRLEQAVAYQTVRI